MFNNLILSTHLTSGNFIGIEAQDFYLRNVMVFISRF